MSHHYEDAPYLHRSVGEWLLEKGIRGLGSDCWGDEPIWDPGLKAEEFAPIHRLLLPAGVVLLENLTNMLQLSRPKVQLIALPLLLPGADGSPVRAVAIEE
jgi:kynurenine formamidase